MGASVQAVKSTRVKKGSMGGRNVGGQEMSEIGEDFLWPETGAAESGPWR